MKPPADITRVVRLLDGAYGRPVWKPRLAPVDELVYTVLSQNTADVNTDRTFAALKARFGSWSAVRDAPVEEIQASIAPGGLSATKAPRIKEILGAIAGTPDREPSLSGLESMDDDAAAAYLTSLPGVGPKTAACVLMFALGRPVMPVDTHVYRVGRRLGLVPDGVTVEAAHPLLTEMAGPEDAYALHVNLVRHGRRVCHARRPACAGCPLRGVCPSAGLV